MKRIGMLTSGGDCQALNAAMRGVVKSILNADLRYEAGACSVKGRDLRLFGWLQRSDLWKFPYADRA